MDSSDHKFMRLAIRAALKCKGLSRDPLVGAVAVVNGKVVGTAFRGEKIAGEHAEFTLLERNLEKFQLAGATVYTTLEPCTKRNPPKLACVDRLIQRKISRIVIGMLDPNPLVSGLGYRKLREANIDADLFPPKLMAELEELNRSFIQSIKTDAVRRSTQQIAILATRSVNPRQREAIGATLRECLDSLSNINKGQIRIPGREAGYFKRFLERIEESPEPEKFKAFIRVVAFDPEDIINNSWFENFYHKLESAVKNKQASIEYIFLIRTKEPEGQFRDYIDRYKKFAERLAFVSQSDSRIRPESLRPSIVLMETQKAAFTHDRADDSSLLQATEWVAENDYNRLADQYKRIELISTLYYSRARAGGIAMSRAAKPTIENVATQAASDQLHLSPNISPEGTVTLLFSDIVDSTKIIHRIGDAKWIELLHQHDRIFRTALSRYKGHEIKTVGDAFMLAFQSSRDALRYAIHVQRVFADRNMDAEEAIWVRMGLHTGELTKRESDFFGRHVNFAARIAAAAGGAEILISSLLRDVVHPFKEFHFSARKPRTLKGFKGSHRLYSLRWRK